MASYIGKVQIATGEGSISALVGSTLYGLCYTAAGTVQKDITANTTSPAITGDYVNTSYDNPIRGSTIHIKFVNGNTVTSGASLLVGTLTNALNVVGNFTCPANTIISFTLDENQNWVVNDNVDTNTEYVFKSQYDPTNKRVITENDVGDAAEKGVVNNLTGNTSSTDLPTAAAVAAYVQEQTGGLSGLTGAMHFRGSVDPLPEATAASTYNDYISGDVVLGPDDKEYVYLKGDSAANSEWIELGDEGSYVLQSSQSTTNINNVTGLTGGTLPTLTPAPTTASLVTVVPGTAPSLSTNTTDIPVVTQAGTATTAAVDRGVLTITVGSNTTLRETDASVISTASLNAGTTPSTVTSTDVNFGAVGANSFNGGTFPTVAASPVTVVIPAPNP